MPGSSDPELLKDHALDKTNHVQRHDRSIDELVSRLLVVRIDQTGSEVLQLIEQLSQIIVTHSSSKDAFRRSHGFEALLRVLRETSQGASLDSITTTFTSLFRLLSSLLSHHNGNQRYYKKHCGGWSILERAVVTVLQRNAEALNAGTLSQDAISRIGQDLLSLAVGDFDNSHPASHMILQQAEAAAILVTVSLMSELIDASAYFADTLNNLAILCESSINNQVLLWNTAIISKLVKSRLTHFGATARIRECTSRILQSILDLGLSNLNDVADLFMTARESTEAQTLLLDILKRSKQPAFVQFDLKKHGYSSVELSSLPRSFPPATGYSFSAWLRIDNFDADYHTTIFGLFDPSQTCFVLVYLERDTQQLILQTAIKSTRPSVRFKTITFDSGRWYHVALVHRKHSSDPQQSSASLFVDGEFVEQVKCTYPEPPPASRESKASISRSGADTSPVQFFLGTPRDLAFKLGENQTSSQWSIALAHLFQTSLSDEYVAVQYRLGPRYVGNFQDCLGPLLTYRASAELNRYNELLHPDKSEKSDIVRATEGRGSDVVAESKILLGFSPHFVVSFNDEPTSMTVLPADLDPKATDRYRKLLTSSTAIALNSAVPSVNEAFLRPYGTSRLNGDPVIALPLALDNSSWCLAGTLAPLYKLVELSMMADTLLRSVEIFFECAKDNWRISELMEKNNGYGVLAILLREKLAMETGSSTSSSASRKSAQSLPIEQREQFAFDCLRLILAFVGYDAKAPEKSMIINPMAYRILIIDFDTWRRCDQRTIDLYYAQFDHFCHRNLHQAFNQKRLGRMRVVRKLVDAMKVEDLTAESIEPLMLTLRRVLESSSAQHSFKELAMFVAYGLQDERLPVKIGTPSIASTARLRQHAGHGRKSGSSTPTSVGESSRSPPVSRSQLATRTMKLLVEVVSECTSPNSIRRFVKAIPTRWLLHMLSEPDVSIVVLDLTMISQATVLLGQEFKFPFADKNGGFTATKARLKSLWQTTTVWRLCFSMLLGQRLTLETTHDTFTVSSLAQEFLAANPTHVANPELLPVLLAMLEAGLRHVVKTEEPVISEAKLIETVIQFLSELYTRSSSFRDVANTSAYIQDLLFLLYPVIVDSDRLSAETELHAEKDTLSFKGEEVVMRPHSNSLNGRPPSVRSLNMNDKSRTPSPRPRRIAAGPRRLSSFVLVNADSGSSNLPTARFNPVLVTRPKDPVKLNIGNTIVDSLLEMTINLFVEQICNKKDFNGIGLFQKVPPGFKEHQAYFESYVLLHTITQLWSYLRLNQDLLQETKILTNLSRFCQHLAEAVFEGWFIDGAQPVMDFVGKILEYLQEPVVAELKAVRLCSQAVNSMRVVFLRVTLLRLSELDESTDEQETVAFLQQMCYWQTILFSSENQETLFTKLICFLLYLKITSPILQVRLAAATLWRLVLIQKPTESATILTVSIGSGHRHLSTGFMRLVQINDEEFIGWVDKNRNDLDSFLIESLAKPWADFVADENRRNEETARSRLIKRREKLRQWQQDESSADEFLHRFELSTNHWRSNIHSQERLKLQRAIQDHQEAVNGITAVMAKLERRIHQPAGLYGPSDEPRWRLDFTEGRNRMRRRIMRDRTAHKQAFQSKRKASELRAARRLTLQNRIPEIKRELPTPTSLASGINDNILEEAAANHEQSKTDSISGSQLLEGEFEMIEDPNEDQDGMIEDKNRKVMTSLQRGDMVLQLHNISRIIGLEACEGLLVVGKKCLYLQDNFFQRSDGEIVSVTQAPEDERDPYLQLISGKDVGSQPTKSNLGEQITRHWTWAQVLSVSKRRFLLRNVALEIFFSDGRSYLLTCMNTRVRDDLYAAIVSHAPHIHSKTSMAGDDFWRLDNLRNPEEAPSSIGSKFANVFSGASGYAATKSWIRGQMSNFQYLMLINTLAGRSFNDLTQYPVFPWVLADYHSEELDLADPRSFRNFSKPMGAQTPAREAEFRDRYNQFAEMSDQSAPAFNYGTHYSSAMIVSSYLIRLQPFVQTYLLLQGGSFDHADRLFDSVEKAWLSASRDNMSDVRELTPEFFYLPEFFTNLNRYDFGLKQGDGSSVNDVQLPPWAKGDPHVFIIKHREALESPYVSSQLHHWIDLVFGYKQRGEAAIAATNVFQHLSYDGAKDLDTIDDPVERLATIGIIHSFGQTPHQLFHRPHPAREVLDNDDTNYLDTEAEYLVCLPSPLFESAERVSRLVYSKVQERLLCCGPGKANIMPACDRYMQWKTTDNSLRFYSSNTKRLVGLYENTHVGAITDACFADSKTLITAGVDRTLGIWTLVLHRDWIELQSQTTLFGHRSPIGIVTASRVWSTILSVAIDGQVLLWDINRFECIRELCSAGCGSIQAAAIHDITGNIVLCTGPDVLLYTLNGHLLLKQRVCDDAGETVACCAFYEAFGNEWTTRQLLFTGHSHGIVNAWALMILSDGTWHLQLVTRLNHTDIGSEDGANIAATITAVLPMASAVYTGDSHGKVWHWEVLRKQGVANGRVK